jgi:hydroxymethylpyrimidine pyrophosphatase-like HAD family hydrolase
MPFKLVVLDIGGTLIGDHGEVPDAMLGAFSRGKYAPGIARHEASAVHHHRL